MRLANQNPPSVAAGPPTEVASVPPPQDLYPTSDIRFVLVEIGKLNTKIDHLISVQEKFGSKLDTAVLTIDRVKTGSIVAGVILSAVIALFWWAIGDRVENAARKVLTDPAFESSSHKALGVK